MRLSFTTKMPCPSFALPAGEECHTGRKLMGIIKSVCKSCYARRGNYLFPGAATLRRENLDATKKAIRSPAHAKKWVTTLTGFIHASGSAWFRWHDSGDIISERHLHMVFDVCEQTPDVKHWVPTREYAFVQSVLLSRPMPKNCTVRLSAHMVGETLNSEMPTSSVGAEVGNKCPATYKAVHEGKCLDCRGCWDKRVKNVDYKRH